ncbi:hypothetical protein B9Z51_06350 [Limnohabitans sp. T6-5]|uniref:hypothetical protein n=1 Tax=Limnohabitans sp. T6-5 TaxID=1100724 RepID=UPI000D37D0BB|nr:hypothetical protein [Limnohabitans sp. T6-5]PUE08574.1 hypothetical protein B9Z51_06350 [Limnohabitans sp. T6-5]
MTHPLPPSNSQDAIPAEAEIPTLNAALDASLIPEAVRVALDVREAERAALFSMSNELLDGLRPELDRLTTELVRRSIQGLWEKRSEKYQNPKG